MHDAMEPYIDRKPAPSCGTLLNFSEHCRGGMCELLKQAVLKEAVAFCLHGDSMV
jgi:hypothetical protein